MVGQVVDPEAEVEGEPDDDNWSECCRDAGNTERLDGEEEDQNGTRDTDDCALAQARIDDIETRMMLVLY